MYRKTNKKSNLKKTKRIMQKKGGYAHRNVSLHCKPNQEEYPIICNVCGNNDYIERFSTLGKSKENQVVMGIFTGDTFDNINNISTITYFCRICGMAKIVRRDDNNKSPYIYTKPI